jgi:site-specific DNA-methyltransferase (adenine-specific)
MVFRKRYSSKSAFLQYRHEAAFLLIKGNPSFPAAPLPDVMDWTYTGNRFHPTQKSVENLKPMIEAFTSPEISSLTRSPAPVRHVSRRYARAARWTGL